MAKADGKVPEPEALAMLRHRFGRTIEIWTAYHVFLTREVDVGPRKTCVDETIVEQTTHTLNMVFYSFVYSIFDPSGVSFPKISQTILKEITPIAIEARTMVIEAERRIHGDLAKIRSNIGFHQGANRKKHKVGYGAYNTFHPGIPMLIMHGLRVFFREVAKTHESSEPYAKPVDDAVTAKILQHCRNLENEIAEDDGADLPSMLIQLGERMRKSAFGGNS